MTTGAQTWRDLLFLHYEVPHAWLRERVPPELELDAFDGRVFVGIVPFTMGRVWFGPVYGGTFLETNVRTYVRSGDTTGVFFSSLDCEHLDTNLVPGSPIDLALATRDGVRAHTFSKQRA